MSPVCSSSKSSLSLWWEVFHQHFASPLLCLNKTTNFTFCLINRTRLTNVTSRLLPEGISTSEGILIPVIGACPSDKLYDITAVSYRFLMATLWPYCHIIPIYMQSVPHNITQPDPASHCTWGILIWFSSIPELNSICKYFFMTYTVNRTFQWLTTCWYRDPVFNTK